MEFLHGAWPGGLADPIPMGVEPAPRVEPAVATHLDASHRVFPPHKLMAPCVVLKGPHSTHRSDAPNMMGRCACCMPPASLTAALAPYACHVKVMAPPPKNRVGSVRSCILCRR